MLLDFYRFSSESVIGFMKESVEAIRKYSDKPITTNMLDSNINSGTGIDYFEMSKALDFVSWDNYIEFQWGIADPAVVSKDHALLRSYKKQPFWVMEQQSGPCGWSKMGPAPTPGKLRLWTYQAIANGADTVVYFRWRACPFGTEEYWHGILNHDGKPNRRYEEISKVGSELAKLSRFFGPLQPKAKVAIVKSFDSEWSHSIHQHVENFHYDKFLLDYYKPLYEMGIPVDFVTAGEDLSDYSLVMAPALLMVTEEEKTNLHHYAKGGGNLLFTFRSGIKDMHNNMRMETVPGIFADLTGVEVMDYDPQFRKETRVSGVFGEGRAALWCDVVTPTTARCLGVYTSDYYAGKPCLTVNEYGKGHVYYMGCDLDEAAMDRLMKYLALKSGIPIGLYSIKGLETVDVTDGETEATFMMNHNGYPVVAPLHGPFTELLTGDQVDNAIAIEPYGVVVLAKS